MAAWPAVSVKEAAVEGCQQAIRLAAAGRWLPPPPAVHAAAPERPAAPGRPGTGAGPAPAASRLWIPGVDKPVGLGLPAGTFHARRRRPARIRESIRSTVSEQRVDHFLDLPTGELGRGRIHRDGHGGQLFWVQALYNRHFVQELEVWIGEAERRRRATLPENIGAGPGRVRPRALAGEEGDLEGVPGTLTAEELTETTLSGRAMRRGQG